MKHTALMASIALLSFATQAENIYRFKMPKDILSNGLPKSCAQILLENPNAKSGEVTIFPNGLQGNPIEVFCDMDTDGGGWTRILSVGVGKTRCFGDFTLNPDGYCVKNTRLLSFNVSTLGIPFSEIRGGVSAYQSGSNDGFRRYVGGSGINDTYVDGISFTYTDSSSSRQHVFTYAIGQSQAGNRQSCPDIGGDSPPPFVGSNFYCESGNPDVSYDFGFYAEEILAGYEFKRPISSGSVQELEVRVMNDQGTGDENIALNGIYVFIR